MDHIIRTILTTDAAIGVFEQYSGKIVSRSPQAVGWVDEFLSQTVESIGNLPPERAAASALLPLLLLGTMDREFPEYLFLDV